MRFRANQVAGLTGLFVLACQPAHARTLDIAPRATTGPAADYPVVVGAPFTVDGTTYTPADTLNYDAVGYAALTPENEGSAISGAHRTLPLPCYVEVTSLETGRTILVRLERRGPMQGDRLLALAPAAAAQLGVAGQAKPPIRVRRVNPPEIERALLRSNQTAPARMDTPKSLLGVLMRKLDPQAPVLLTPMPVIAPAAGTTAGPKSTPKPPPTLPATKPVVLSPRPVVAKPVDARQPTPAPKALPARVPDAPIVRRADIREPSPKIVASKVEPVKREATSVSKPKTAAAGAAPAAKAAAPGHFMVQVGAFANKPNAGKLAGRLGGSLKASGTMTRVVMGPFTSQAQAAAALAKAKAAGYSDARIQHAD